MNGTGLLEREVRKLSVAQKRELAAWTFAKSGGEIEKGLPFLPNAIRWLELEQRVELATDVARDAAWEESERRKVRDGGELPSGLWVPGHAYFTEAYGHLRPPTGPPVPFDLWPEQRQVLDEIREHLRQIWLKARQLGMTWLALHDAFHLLAFEESTPAARILALSRIGGDASKLLMRSRQIKDHLPPFLRPEEAMDTKRSMTRFGIVGRGEMVSLMGTPDAPRMETATLTLLDEFGFYRNRGAGATWTAAEPTLGATGRAIILSTGNGPAEVPGDGQAFAQLVERAMSSGRRRRSSSRASIFVGELKLVFLPASTDPDRRSEAWRDSKRDNYLTEEEFEAEHPETIKQALQGQPKSKVYPLAGIAAAEAYGRELDELRKADELPPPAAPERAEIVTVDWGEQTHALELWPLERGGFYVVREVVHKNREPEELVEPLLGEALTKPAVANYDAAGVQSMRTFLATARRGEWPQLRSKKIPFGDYKEEAIRYARRLFRRTDRLLEQRAEDPDVAMSQVVAISPEGCPVLLSQLRGLEFDEKNPEKIRKENDHGPDAYLAGIAPTARRFRALQEEGVEEPDREEI